MKTLISLLCLFLVSATSASEYEFAYYQCLDSYEYDGEVYYSDSIFQGSYLIFMREKGNYYLCDGMRNNEVSSFLFGIDLAEEMECVYSATSEKQIETLLMEGPVFSTQMVGEYADFALDLGCVNADYFITI